MLNPAKGLLLGLLSTLMEGYFVFSREKTVSTSATSKPKWSKPACRPALRGLIFMPT
ncbi:MAG: hypothetical protein HYS67_03760 [Deltaproteobacteria bacterium]|nr:hypothetical protein [Deltaproteobacteria bacterium]